MAESIRFDFLSSGADRLARDFKNTGDNAAAAARGAKVLQTTIEQLGQKENRTAAESATLAKALKLTGDAEDRAAAKALAADIAIRRLDDAMADSSKSSDRAGGGFLGLTGAVTGFGDAATAASGESTLFQKALAGINLATGVLEPALAGVVVAVGGLAAGLVSAGAALSAFGLVAGANLSAAGTAATKASTAQTAYTAAVAAANAKYKEQIGTATTAAQRQAAATARQNALQSAQAAQVRATTAAYAGLTPAQVTLSKSIGAMQDRWQKFTASFAPQVSSIVGVVQPLFGTVLKYVGKLATAGGTAIQALLPSLGVALNSKGFKDFIGTLADNAGPAIVKLGVAIGHIATGFGGILKAFLPFSQGLLSGLDKITAKFATWGQTLSSHSGFQSLIATFKTETPLAIQLLQNLGTVLVNVGKAVTGLAGVGNSKALLQALLPLSGVLASLSKNTDLDRIVLYLIAARSAAVKLGPAFLGIKAAVSFFPSAWAAIVKFSGAVEGAAAKEVIAGAAAKVWAGAQAVLNAVMDANPIVLVAAAVAALAAGFVIAWKKSSLFRDIIKDIGKVFLQFGILWVQETKVIVDTFLNMVGIVIRGAADAFGWVPGLGGKLKGASTAFTNWKNSVSGDLDKVIGNMRGWQKELDASKQTTDAATSAIVKDMTRAGGSAVIARDDVATYTRAVQDNGAKSNAARSARANLIHDLENAGLNARDANRLVNNLQTAINRMHGKTVSVGVHGSGSGGVQVTPSTGVPGAKKYSVYFTPLAAGGRIPGFGGGDQHPALLESGEAVVDKHRTRQYAPVLKAMGVPGMASGGLVGAVGSIGAAGAADGAASVRADISAYVTNLKKLAAQAAASAAAGLGNLPLGTGPHSGSAAVAQAFAKSILWAYGWGTNQFPPLQALWNQESGWNSYAVNPSSGAYGIPQSLGHGHPYNLGDYQAQIRWGLAYIKQRYGSPAAAEGHELAYHWYDKGGLLKPGLTLAYNGTGRPEQVIPAGRGAGGGNTYVINAPHYVGSHNDLVRALDDLGRQGRLPR